jgi:hypothetical protein
MGKSIKYGLDHFLKGILHILAGEGFSNKEFSSTILFKHFLIQKVLRINGHVPWPVHRTSVVHRPEKIQRGTRCPGLSPWCYLDGRNGIIIGENTWIGPRVSIISMDHDLYDFSKYVQERPIKIGKNCWIGTGAIILSNVELGDHTIVAAGAVVTKSFPANVMVGGVPAKVIKQLGDYASLSEEANT